jgi:hypothetical protein
MITEAAGSGTWCSWLAFAWLAVVFVPTLRRRQWSHFGYFHRRFNSIQRGTSSGSWYKASGQMA